MKTIKDVVKILKEECSKLKIELDYEQVKCDDEHGDSHKFRFKLAENKYKHFAFCDNFTIDNKEYKISEIRDEESPELQKIFTDALEAIKADYLEYKNANEKR